MNDLPVQTWMLWGGQPVIWTVPIFARQTAGHWTAELAINLRPSQVAIVSARLVQAGCRPAGSSWLIDPTVLPKIAEPVVGQDLEAFYSWSKPQLAQQDRFKPERRLDRDAFLDALFAKGVGASRSEVEIWWNRFCNHIVDWLLNHERPVDLYFGQLQPSPYRRVWKERCLRILKRRGCRPVGLFSRLRHGPELPAELTHPRLLALTARGFIRRSIEIETNPQWTALAVKVEHYRLAALGAEKYATFTIARLREFLPVARRLFLAWMVDTRGRSATLVPRGAGDPLVLAQNLPPALMPVSDRRFYRRLSPVMLRTKPESYGRRPLRKNRELRPLPDVQPDTPNVRDPRPVLPEQPHTYD